MGGTKSALRLRTVARPGTALAVGILTVLMLAATAVLGSIAHQPVFDGLSHALVYLSFEALAGTYVALDYRQHGGRLPMGWVAVLLSVAWAPAIVLAGLALLLFPDGRVPSARWRPLLVLYFGLGALWLGGAFGISAAAIADHRIDVDSTGALQAVNNPAGADAWFGDPPVSPGFS